MDEAVNPMGSGGQDAFTPPDVMDLIRSLQDRVAALEAAQMQQTIQSITDAPPADYMIRQIDTHLSQREAP